MTQSEEPGPFGDIRVLDFSRVLAGPYCTAMLADLGADVIKVEPPGGDDQRAMGVVRDGESANFALINRGKRSIRLDLKSPAGLGLAHALAAQADVVVENFRPGVAARLGIGHEQLRSVRPDLIYCSISGFGQEGKLADRPSYDVVTQAMSGLMSVTGEADRPPMLVGESIADVSSGVFAAFGIASALYHRARTGQGRYLDVAMFDVLLGMMPTAMARYLGRGEVPGRHGNRHALTAPFGAYRARDGFFILAVANNALFRRLAQVMARGDWVEGPEFATVQSRAARRELLASGIEEWASDRSVAEVVSVLLDAGVPASPIWTVAEAMESEHARQRELVRPVAHPVFADFRAPTQPVRFGGLARPAPRPAPGLGADGADILREVLKLDPDSIEAHRRDGTI